MVGVISLLVALTVSLVITRVAAMALMFTGMSRESARFQARSAFSGVGYTTHEAESTVNHPVRRQIIMLLMLLGNIGVATVVATLMVSVTSTAGASWHRRGTTLGILIAGLVLLWVVFNSRWVERRMNRVIAWALKTFTDLDVRDYVSLLELSNGYAVSEMIVDPGDWLAGSALADLRLSDEGILVLGIRPTEGEFHGTPRGDDLINVGDKLILYGDLEDIQRLDQRRKGRQGDKEHLIAVEEQEEYEQFHRLERLGDDGQEGGEARDG
ncbi:MAG: potassium transporter TrkA [Planctomycetales bacterium]|nr:potassium transporter TrkA [Planctomycetales bacterium]